MGATFFNRAEAYGLYTNEELIGEAVEPFLKEIIVTIKFGFKDGARHR